jgi:hypothetical protein
MTIKTTGIHSFASRRIAGAAAFAVLLLADPTSALAEAIAVADGERSGVRADIMELKRSSGDTVTLRFTLVNESGGRLSIKDDPLGGNHRDAREVHLINAAGQKKYLVLTDSANNCVCSAQLPFNIESGSSLNLWARFPAPPADVAEVSVIVPRFIPVDVPISE